MTTKRVAFLTSNSGVEEAELTSPWEAVRAAGAIPTHLAPDTGEVKAFNNDVEPGDTFTADVAVKDATENDYDLLVIPGGTTNADGLRTVPEAVSFVKAWVQAGKPVAAICHGPWVLVEADVLHGKTLTSYPSLQTDIRNAGGTWVDREAFVCPAGGWTLVTSRNPDDLDAFDQQIRDLLG